MRSTAAVVLLVLSGCSATSYRSSSCGRATAYGPAPGLRAGVIDDHDRIGDYVAFVDSMPRGDVPKIDLADRRILTFVTPDGTPLWDSVVRFEVPGRVVLEARTSAKGEALFAGGALGVRPSERITAYVDGFPADVNPSDDVVVVGNRAQKDARTIDLDVALCIDTTSSMDDEVASLRTSLLDVIRRISATDPGIHLRIGGVAYRDRGDDYVTKPFDFTSDMASVERTVATLQTGGGGDHYEAVHEALDASLSRLSWRRDGAIRILFLIGDAGPHLERSPDSIEIARRATAQGIQIIPIGCSGLDDVGELVWRQLAVLTLGKFLFVSYGGTTDHHVGVYEENDLDELMVRSIAEAVEAVRHPVRRLPAPPVFTQTYAPIPSPYVGQGQALTPYFPVPPVLVGQGQAPAPYFAPRGPAIGVGRSPVDFGYWR